MSSFNKCILMGNLTRDPELRETPKGVAVCGFSIAVNRTWTTEGGEKKEEVSFLDCEAFGRSAENIGQYFKKGKPIFIEARAKQDSWEDRETKQKRTKIKFIVDSWQFCGGDAKGGETPRSTRQSAVTVEGKTDDGGVDQDVPF